MHLLTGKQSPWPLHMLEQWAPASTTQVTATATSSARLCTAAMALGVAVDLVEPALTGSLPTVLNRRPSAKSSARSIGPLQRSRLDVVFVFSALFVQQPR